MRRSPDDVSVRGSELLTVSILNLCRRQSKTKRRGKPTFRLNILHTFCLCVLLLLFLNSLPTQTQSPVAGQDRPIAEVSTMDRYLTSPYLFILNLVYLSMAFTDLLTCWLRYNTQHTQYNNPHTIQSTILINVTAPIHSNTNHKKLFSPTRHIPPNSKLLPLTMIPWCDNKRSPIAARQWGQCQRLPNYTSQS